MAEQQQLTEAPAPSQKPTPEDPAPSSGPEAYASVCSPAPDSRFGFRAKLGQLLEREDNYNRCLFFYGKLCLVQCMLQVEIFVYITNL